MITDQIVAIPTAFNNSNDERIKFEEDELSNVFVIMRYKDKSSKFREIETAIRDALKDYGLNAVLAKDDIFYPELWNHVRFCMDHCIFAIAVFDSLTAPDYSPNVALELGYMLALRRHCLILKDDAIPYLATDIIGHLYSKFNLNNATQTIGDAVSLWLEKIGYTRIQPAETIAGETADEAKKQRTRRIIESLKVAYKEPPTEKSERLLRQAASISSLAISELEKHKDEEYHRLLLAERDSVLELLDSGWIVRILVCPDAQVESAELHRINKKSAEFEVYPRYKQFVDIIKKELNNSNLQIAFSLRLPHENILIVESSVAFVGRRRRYQFGFPYTTIIHDPTIIKDEKSEFDLLFWDSVALILNKEPNSEVEQYFGSKELKEKVLEKMSDSKKRLQELLS